MNKLNLILKIVVINVLINLSKYFWRRYSKSSRLVNSVEEAEKCSKEREDDEVLAETRYGIITNIFNGYGLIDKEIYFDFNTLVGLEKPKEGLLVLLSVGKRQNEHKLVAERVEVVRECWDVEGAELNVAMAALVQPNEKASVGKITQINEHNICWINDQFSIDLKETNVVDLSPVVGDWVCVNDLNSQPDSQMKYKMTALRSRQFIGRITRVGDKIAVIDNHIYFVVESGDYVASVGDEVRGVAIESSYEDFEWRASSVIPQVKVADQVYEKHMNERLQSVGQLVTDRNGVSITSPLDFGTVITGSSNALIVHIRNEGDKGIPLPSCYFKDNNMNQLSSDKVLNCCDNRSRRIRPGEEATFKLSCSPKLLGTFKYLLYFDFGEFQICRLVTFKSEDSRQQLLKNDVVMHTNRRRYDRNEKVRSSAYGNNRSQWILPGRRVDMGPEMRLPVYILRHAVPDELWECFRDERDLLQWVPCLQHNLNWKNYKEKFSTLLHLEEIQHQEEMAQFNMEKVIMREEDDFLVLEVPHLSEGRPSVIVGDKVVVSDSSIVEGPEYEGYIHQVRSNEILLKFHPSYHDTFSGGEADIRFVCSRTSFRRCHQAVHLFYRIGSQVLFPVKSKPQRPKIQFNRQKLINSMLNERQLCSVRSILSGCHAPAPYIIYGPPGTGKTVTVIEAILQIFLLRSDSRILVCAPSNSAADLLCERLHLSECITAADLVRLNAAHRLNKELPMAVEPYCHSSLPVEVMYRYRIIICTCVTAGVLYQMGVRPGHFTHVFIDEAGQATECEVLIPISVAAAENVKDLQIILAGDPQQLGPVIRSSDACAYGLQTSFLERLCKFGPYLRDETQAGGYDANYVTKLINNYRSHAALIEVPSQLFYHSELVPVASPTLTHCLLHWSYLTNKEMPVLFHGIRSEDLQEHDSPSWFNPEEIIQVIIYLQSLYSCGLQPRDVGIITPYRRQVEKINQMLKALDVVSPKVGSVEEFQGQERKAMLVSTVRSSDDWLLFDQYNNIGFLSNPKRFNVTVTRAQALLIVVGNPFVLIKDFYWRKLISYCLLNDAYVGVDREELNKLLEAMQNDSNVTT